MDFNSILIGSEDPERLVEYYTRVLGKPGFSDGGYTGWQLGSGFVTVGPHSEVKGKNAAPGRIIWNIESKDVAGDFERMQGRRGDRHRGAVCLRGRTRLVDRDVRRPGRQLLPAPDPDGAAGRRVETDGPAGTWIAIGS